MGNLPWWAMRKARARQLILHRPDKNKEGFWLFWPTVQIAHCRATGYVNICGAIGAMNRHRQAFVKRFKA
ncbi:MAG: hypothetical protein EBV97_06005 [Rhodobacteraceae bacterium]|nr:hypothetical protein [Paracoccaceae bacterium]